MTLSAEEFLNTYLKKPDTPTGVPLSSPTKEPEITAEEFLDLGVPRGEELRSAPKKSRLVDIFTPKKKISQGAAAKALVELQKTEIENSKILNSGPIKESDSVTETTGKLVARSGLGMAQGAAGLVQYAGEANKRELEKKARGISKISKIDTTTSLGKINATFKMLKVGSLIAKTVLSDSPVSKKISGLLSSKGEAWTAALQKKKDEFEYNVEEYSPLWWYANGIEGAATTMLPAVIATTLTKNPAVGMRMIFPQVLGATYGGERLSGSTPLKAGNKAMYTAILETLSEFIPLKYLDEAKGVLNKLIAGTASEAIQEGFFSELGQIGYEITVEGKQASWAEVWKRVFTSAGLGAVGGSGLGVVSAIGEGNKLEAEANLSRIIKENRVAELEAVKVEPNRLEGLASAERALSKEGLEAGDKGVVVSESVIPETGKPFKFSYGHNKEKALDHGGRFSQDVEPSGKYMVVTDPKKIQDNPDIEGGVVSFKNPLVVDFGEGYTEQGNWKRVLSKRFGGKTGKPLSDAVRRAGYDGIVTISESGGVRHTSEIVDLSVKTKTPGGKSLGVLEKPTGGQMRPGGLVGKEGVLPNSDPANPGKPTNEQRTDSDLREAISTLPQEQQDKVLGIVRKEREVAGTAKREAEQDNFVPELLNKKGHDNIMPAKEVNGERVVDENAPVNYRQIDLDKFKWFNDKGQTVTTPSGEKISGGHPIGDFMLKSFGEMMVEAKNEAGLTKQERADLSRGGGDEFQIIDTTNKTEDKKLDKIVKLLENKAKEFTVYITDTGGNNWTLKGLPFTTGKGKSLSAADKNLQEVKNAKKNSGERPTGRDARPSTLKPDKRVQLKPEPNPNSHSEEERERSVPISKEVESPKKPKVQKPTSKDEASAGEVSEEKINTALTLMLEQSRNSQSRGASTSRDGERRPFVATSPPWLINLNKKAKESKQRLFSRKEIETLATKTLDGKSLTDKQEKRFELLEDAAIEFSGTDGEAMALSRPKPIPKQKRLDIPFKKVGLKKGLKKDSKKGLTAEVFPDSQKVRFSTTGRILTDGHGVNSAGEVASLLSKIRKSAQEILFTVAVDGDGKIIEIHKYGKGTKLSVPVDPSDMAGRVLNIKGAKRVYFVHNHPSGRHVASKEDLRVAEKLRALLSFKGIELETVIIAGQNYSSYSPKATSSSGKITPTKRDVSLPVKEAFLNIKTDKDKLPTLSGSGEVSDFATSELDGGEGFIFLDTRNKPLGFLPFQKGKTLQEATANLYAKAQSVGAVSFVAYTKKAKMPESRKKFLTELKSPKTQSETGLNFFDVVYGGGSTSGSWADSRKVFNGKGLSSLKNDTVLFSGIPTPSIARVVAGIGGVYEKIGTKVWDGMISRRMNPAKGKIANIPGVKVAVRAQNILHHYGSVLLDPAYRGTLPNTPEFLEAKRLAKRQSALGLERGIDLGQRLSSMSEQSQLAIAQAIQGGRKRGLSVKEKALAREAQGAFASLGKRATELGLLSEETFFKNVGKYMPRLYTSKEFKDNLVHFGVKRPSRLDLSRFKKRKDIPKEVREEMGEILTPGYPVAKGISQLTHDVAMAEWFDGIAKNPEWARIPAEKVVGRTKAGRLKIKRRLRDIPEGWKQLKGKKLGSLNGAYVRPEIFAELEQVVRIVSMTEKTWRKALGAWKFGKVILSPKTHMRNVRSNMILAHLGGMPLPDQPIYLKRAFQDLRSSGEFSQIARAEGLLDSTFTKAELGALFDQVESQMSGIKAGAFSDNLGRVSLAANKMKAAGRKAAKLYEASEQWFKVAKTMHNIEKRGMSHKEATKDAEKWLFNYGDLTPFQEGFRSSPLGAPFATFTFKAIPRIAETAIKTPWRFALPAALVYGLQQAAMGLIGDDDDQYKAKKKLRPDYMKGGAFGVPNFARVPYIDAHGREHFWNLSYDLPWGDLASRGGWPGVPSGLTPLSQPGIKTAFELAANYDTFFKRKIVRSEDIAGKTLAKRTMAKGKILGGKLVRDLAPTPVLDVHKMYKAAQRRPDYLGRLRGVPIVLADVLLGVKIYPVDYYEMAQRKINKIHPSKGSIGRRIMSQIRTLHRQRAVYEERGKDTKFYDDQIKAKVEQLRGLAEEAGLFGESFKKIQRSQKKPRLIKQKKGENLT